MWWHVSINKREAAMLGFSASTWKWFSPDGSTLTLFGPAHLVQCLQNHQKSLQFSCLFTYYIPFQLFVYIFGWYVSYLFLTIQRLNVDFWRDNSNRFNWQSMYFKNTTKWDHFQTVCWMNVCCYERMYQTHQNPRCQQNWFG